MRELGHIGVTAEGVQRLVTVLESKALTNSCRLCAVDISGHDGEPDVSKKLQSRLTKALVKNAKRANLSRKYASVMRLPVWKCHNDDD